MGFVADESGDTRDEVDESAGEFGCTTVELVVVVTLLEEVVVTILLLFVLVFLKATMDANSFILTYVG